MNGRRNPVDPLCGVACGLYLLNRGWMKAHLGGSFLHGHFNDLLMIPAALPMVLWLHGRLGWRNEADPPAAGEILFHFLIWSFLCEVAGPRLNPRSVGDPLDVLCYAIGGALAWLWWHRRSLPPLRVPR